MEPNPREIDALVAQFNDGRYPEVATLAQTMTERFPQHAFGWKVLGAVLSQMGRNAESLIPMRKAVALSYDDADAHSNLGNAQQYLGQLDDAVASYRRALDIKPEYADAHNNLGNALRDLGQLDEAVASCRRALEIRPDFAYACGNLGNALQNIGKVDDAVASYRRALVIKPDYADAQNNLGNALQDLGKVDDAVASYQRALDIKPDYADALNNLSVLNNERGNSVLALRTIQQSLLVKETQEARRIFVDTVKHLHFKHDDDKVRVTMVRALTENWGSPSKLAHASLSLVKLNPCIRAGIARANNAWPARLLAQELFGSNSLTTLAADPLLIALLDSLPVFDIEMERFLTIARHAMLEVAAEMIDSAGEVSVGLSFYAALARQCFINEYLFSYTDDEIQKATELRDSLVAAMDTKTPVSVLWLVAVAAYFPLFSLPLATRLLDSQWPEQVAAVLTLQVMEPREEMQLRNTIPQLTNIEDVVSLLVQNQYEENPYPRWIRGVPAVKAKNIIRYLGDKFPLASFERHGMSGSIDVLIAGCGTGQHSIQAAQRIQGAKVLAIDLSMASLSYAKRKTRQLNVTSIEYAQADLLELGSLGKSFDLIESSGVLHHLADPWAGLRVLLSLLRPNGFMNLGFYSDMARQNIVRARGVIAEQGYGETASEIRQCHQYLLDLDKNKELGNVTRSSDFFSISTCRDMLFHVQEHRMTLKDIDAFLRENDLTFIGFEIDGRVLQKYKLRFPGDRAANNLYQWQVFEHENPDTFLGMYQFWIQKGC